MKRPQKRIAVLTVIIILLLVAVMAGIRYLPLNKILRISSVPETDFVNDSLVNQQAPSTLFFDFEVDPNTGNKDGLRQGIAHSGQFAAKAFGKNSYSIAINRSAGEIGLENLKAAAMSAWIYIYPTEKEVQGAYVFSVNNDLGVNICWKSVSVSGMDLPKEKWFKISGLFDLSDIKWKPGYKIQVYFWNNSSSDILVDDYYIVFGGPGERRGDSTLVDMTREQPFVPRFNFPPFPVLYFEKQEAGNRNSPFIINDGNTKTGNISPLAVILTGRFTQDPDGVDDLLVIEPDRKVEMYHFCRDKSRFTMTLCTIPPDLMAFFYGGEILKGSFTGVTGEQLTSLSNGLIRIGSFGKVKDPCSGNGEANTTFGILSSQDLKALSAGEISDGDHLIAADFDNDKLSEILSIGKNGTWTMIKFIIKSNSWKVLASDLLNPVPEWVDAGFTFSVSAGKFIERFPQDLVLTVFASKKGDDKGYSIRRFDNGTRQFLPVFPGKQQFTGKTIGLDTLSPGDQFFTGYFDGSGASRIFRYNRDWRFDLKEIKFNDTTFRIIANMDFSGYEADHNPRYYGVLKIIPGRFASIKETSLLLVGRNCKTGEDTTGKCNEFVNLPFLPDFVQLYAYPEQMK